MTMSAATPSPRPLVRASRNGLFCLAALLAGAGGVFGFAPFGWFVLLWLSLAVCYGLLCRAADGARRAADGAWLAGSHAFGLFLAGVSWIYVSLSVFGGMPLPLAGLATLLFCALLASVALPFGALFVSLAPAQWLARSLFFAALFTLTEWARSWLFTGFPWLASGYSQSPPSPLAGFAPLFGVYGLSFLSAWLAALMFEIARRWLSCELHDARRWWRWCPALPLLLVGAVLGTGTVLREISWTTASGEGLSVALLQGNVAQEMKWRPERLIESLQTYYRLAEEHPAQLTVLPETALPAFLDQIPGDYLEALARLADRRQGDMLLGVPVADGKDYFNAAISVGSAGWQRYDKRHLVPFGEFVPPGFQWFMTLIDIPLSDFTAGGRNQPPLRLSGEQVAVNICYEDVFGNEIIGALPQATLLVNISNVAWFGDSLAPAQHLQIARLRALESGRMMLRATNTGMTAIVDRDGTVLAALPPFTRGALVGEVRGYRGATPYVHWGNAPAVGLALLLVVGTALRERLKRKN